jgi:hypothetical protein
METFTLRWSADRSLYFVEPSRGRNARGFWLGVEKKEFPVPPDAIKNPYSGAFAFDGYWRQWFSMRGFIVQQGDPQSKVPASAALVRDYLMPAHMVTLEEARQVIETNQIEAEAAVKEAEAVLETIEKEKLQSSKTGDGSSTTGAPASESESAPSAPDQTEDSEAAAGFSSGGRPSKRDRRRGN